MYKLCNWLPFYRPYSFAPQPFSCFALCSCIWSLYNPPNPRVNAVLSLFVSGHSILRLPLGGGQTCSTSLFYPAPDIAVLRKYARCPPARCRPGRRWCGPPAKCGRRRGRCIPGAQTPRAKFAGPWWSCGSIFAVRPPAAGRCTARRAGLCSAPAAPCGRR